MNDGYCIISRYLTFLTKGSKSRCERGAFELMATHVIVYFMICDLSLFFNLVTHEMFYTVANHLRSKSFVR